MKKYLKILIITLGIQLGCWVLGATIANIPLAEDVLGAVGVIIFLLGFPISIVVDIVLATSWGESVKQRLCYIFLMVSNYTWLVGLIYVIWYVDQWIKMLLNVN